MGLKRGLAYLLAVQFLITGCKKDNPAEPSVNHAPVIERISIDRPEPLTDQRVNLECIAVDEDEDDTLFYDWRSSNGRIENPYSRRVSWTSPSTPGTYQILVRVEDRERESATSSKQISVVSRFDTLYVSDDSFIERNNPDYDGYGYLTFLDIYVNDDFNWFSQIYIKFNNPTTERAIKSAKIRLTINEREYNEETELSCDIHKIINQWSEENIMWNNCPRSEITPTLRFLIPTYEGDAKTFYINGDEIIELVKSWRTENYGLRMVPLQQRIQKYFYSSEGAEEIEKPEYSPALIIEYE